LELTNRLFGQVAAQIAAAQAAGFFSGLQRFPRSKFPRSPVVNSSCRRFAAMTEI
jgi:hypothetical protein